VNKRLVYGLVAAVAALSTGSCTDSGPTEFKSPPPTSNPAASGRISALWITPYPEGPEAYFCPHPEQRIGISTCQRLSWSSITAALGGPAMWPSSTPSQTCSSDTGWIMKVNFVDHTHLVYGPCEHPPNIESLKDALVGPAP
jgi:hypothetical protein